MKEYVSKYAPICLFVYNRLDSLQKLVLSLQYNDIAKESDLYIYSDGPKNERALNDVNLVREYIHTITGFRTITINESLVNKGLAQSVIDGVTDVINEHNKIIVLEDDLICSTNFLSYMNSALDFYMTNDKVFSIAAYTPPIKKPLDDIYFTQRASSWGWGTWKDRWGKINWDLESQYGAFVNSSKKKKQFNKMGSDMTKMLRDQMTGKINSWAIRWCYNQFLMQSYTVHPTVSKINNIGTDEKASNTKDRFNRFFTLIDKSNKTEFSFTNDIRLDSYYLKQFLKQYTIATRLKYKILNKFF